MDENFTQISFLLVVITVVVLLLVLLLVNLMLTGRNRKLKHQSDMQKIQSETREAISTVKLEVAEATLGDVSRDLHDEVGQLLAFTILQLESINMRPESEREKMLTELKKTVRDAMDTVRRISRGLNPDFVNQQGLIKSVDQLFERAQIRASITTTIKTSPDFHFANSANQVIVFRIIRECLTNAIRHGNAQHVSLNVASSNKHMEFTFTDNGSGTDKLPDGIPSLGWKNIQHYASLMQGKVIFNSTIGKGTEIILTIPNT